MTPAEQETIASAEAIMMALIGANAITMRILVDLMHQVGLIDRDDYINRLKAATDALEQMKMIPAPPSRIDVVALRYAIAAMADTSADKLNG